LDQSYLTALKAVTALYHSFAIVTKSFSLKRDQLLHQHLEKLYIIFSQTRKNTNNVS